MAIERIQPPLHSAHYDNLEVPFVFFAGPIQGAPDYQSDLADKLEQSTPSDQDMVIASPRRGKNGGFKYETQVAWEKHNMNRALLFGGVTFWFAAQDHSLPYEDGRAYAQTSRLELGIVLGWRDYNPDIKIAIGFDPQYTPNGGGSQRYISLLCQERQIPVHRDTENLIDDISSQVLKLDES